MALTGEIEIHAASSLTLQLTFEVTEKVALPAPALKGSVVSEVVSTADSPDCEMATVRVMPPPVRVTVPLRELVEGLAVTVTATVVSFVPLAGERVIQTASSLALQGTFALSVKVVLPAPAPKVRLGGDTVRERADAAWDTDMVRVSPPPVMVMMPLRTLESGLAVTEMAMVALFEPLAAESVIHSASSLIAQVTLEMRLTIALPAPAAKVRLGCETVRIASAACWDTSKVLVMPPPETVISPRRGLVVVLASTETVRVALFDPVAGVTESQAASMVVLQGALELMVKLLWPASLAKSSLSVEMERK